MTQSFSFESAKKHLPLAEVDVDAELRQFEAEERDRLGLHDGQLVDLVSNFSDAERRVSGFRVVSYPTPVGCAAAYYPETNPLIAVHHRSIEAGTPASKSVPIRVVPAS